MFVCSYEFFDRYFKELFLFNYIGHTDPTLLKNKTKMGRVNFHKSNLNK